MSLKPFLASTAVTSDVYTDFRWRMLFLCVCFDIEIKGVVDRIYSQAVCLGRNRCLEKVGIRHLQTIMTTVRCYNTYSTALLLWFFLRPCASRCVHACACKLKGTCVPCLHVCTNNNADSSNRLDTVLRMVYASAYPYTCIYVYNHVLLISDRRIRTALQILYKY